MLPARPLHLKSPPRISFQHSTRSRGALQYRPIRCGLSCLGSCRSGPHIFPLLAAGEELKGSAKMLRENAKPVAGKAADEAEATGGYIALYGLQTLALTVKVAEAQSFVLCQCVMYMLLLKLRLRTLRGSDTACCDSQACTVCLLFAP